MLRVVSDVFPTLMSYSWRTFRLPSRVLSVWISILTVKAYGCHLFREAYCSCANYVAFFWRFADRASQYISVINQLDAQNFCASSCLITEISM